MLAALGMARGLRGQAAAARTALDAAGELVGNVPSLSSATQSIAFALHARNCTGQHAQLRRDGRASVLHLADRLGVSRATVRLRLARLLERQEILGFTAITRADAQDAPVRGLLLIGIEGRGADRIMARLTAMAQGRWPMFPTRALQTASAAAATHAPN